METKNVLHQSEIFKNACDIIFDKISKIDFNKVDFDDCQNVLLDIHSIIFNAERAYKFLDEFIKFNSEHEND